MTLDYVPIHDYKEYLNSSKVQPATNVTDGKEAVKVVLENIQVIFDELRNVESLAVDSNDNGTEDLINGIIASYEKTSWMLNAWLG